MVATGESHSVREFAELAFDCAGLDYRKHVVADPNLYRPAEVNMLLGDASKARQRLGWRHSIGFRELVREDGDQRVPVAGSGSSGAGRRAELIGWRSRARTSLPRHHRECSQVVPLFPWPKRLPRMGLTLAMCVSDEPCRPFFWPTMSRSFAGSPS